MEKSHLGFPTSRRWKINPFVPVDNGEMEAELAFEFEAVEAARLAEAEPNRGHSAPEFYLST